MRIVRPQLPLVKNVVSRVVKPDLQRVRNALATVLSPHLPGVRDMLSTVVRSEILLVKKRAINGGKAALDASQKRIESKVYEVRLSIEDEGRGAMRSLEIRVEFFFDSDANDDHSAMDSSHAWNLMFLNDGNQYSCLLNCTVQCLFALNNFRESYHERMTCAYSQRDIGAQSD